MTEFTAGVVCIHAGCCADGTRNYQWRSFLLAALRPSVATACCCTNAAGAVAQGNPAAQVKAAEARIGVVAKVG